jgi:hypothetical protein
MQGALLAAVQKIRSGHFHSRSDWEALFAMAAALNAETDLHPTVLPLAADFVKLVARRASCNRNPGRRLPHLSDVGHTEGMAQMTPRDAILAMSQRLALLTQSYTSDELTMADDILPILIAEVLYSPNLDERLFAGMLISATPYREPLATVLLSELTGNLACWDAALVGSTLRALTMLNVQTHRRLVHNMLIDRTLSPPLRYVAACATPHWACKQSAGAWREVLSAQVSQAIQRPSELDEGILHAITHGIATDGHSELLSDIEHGAISLPHRVRSVAKWWLSLSSAVRLGARR